MKRKIKIGDLIGPGPNYVDQHEAWTVDRIADDGTAFATSISTGKITRVEKTHRILRGEKRHKQLIRLLEKTRSAYHRTMTALDYYYRDDRR